MFWNFLNEKWFLQFSDLEYGGLGLSYKYVVAFNEALGNINCGAIPMAVSVQTDMATPALSWLVTIWWCKLELDYLLMIYFLKFCQIRSIFNFLCIFFSGSVIQPWLCHARCLIRPGVHNMEVTICILKTYEIYDDNFLMYHFVPRQVWKWEAEERVFDSEYQRREGFLYWG